VGIILYLGLSYAVNGIFALIDLIRRRKLRHNF
jgi:hypothetical protein